MRNELVPVGKVFGIRVYNDGVKNWYLLEDILRELKKPKITGKGERKYIYFDRGPWITVKLRLVTAEALLGYARIYSDKPMRVWRGEVKMELENARRAGARVRNMA